MRIIELVSWLAHWWIWWPRHSVGRGGYGTPLEVGATALCWKWWLRHSVQVVATALCWIWWLRHSLVAIRTQLKIIQNFTLMYY